MSPPIAASLALALALGLPLAAAAQSPAASCALLSRSGQHYSQTPLPGFDPASAAPLPPALQGADAALVLCHRATIVPEMTDYRIPAEMHLPLAITDEHATVVLDIQDGRLTAAVRKGRPSDEEQAAVKSRVQEMQAAMQAK